MLLWTARVVEAVGVLGGVGLVVSVFEVFELEVQFHGDVGGVVLLAVSALNEGRVTLYALVISLSQRRCFLWRAAICSFKSLISS